MAVDSDIAGALGDNGPPSMASEMEVMRPHLVSRHLCLPRCVHGGPGPTSWSSRSEDQRAH